MANWSGIGPPPGNLIPTAGKYNLLESPLNLNGKTICFRRYYLPHGSANNFLLSI